jgi:hypothetical protein
LQGENERGQHKTPQMDFFSIFEKCFPAPLALETTGMPSEICRSEGDSSVRGMGTDFSAYGRRQIRLAGQLGSLISKLAEMGGIVLNFQGIFRKMFPSAVAQFWT